MKLLYFRREGKLYPGIEKETGIVDVDAYLQGKGKQGLAGRNINLNDLSSLQEAAAFGGILPDGELGDRSCRAFFFKDYLYLVKLQTTCDRERDGDPDDWGNGW